MRRLSELAARCEAAEAPDRELDAVIREAVGGATVPLYRLVKPMIGHPEWEGGASSNGHWLPFYTASLDAALTLVPEGWHWSIYDTNGVDKACAQVEPPEYDYEPHTGEAATPALALCAAALKARTREPDHGE